MDGFDCFEVHTAYGYLLSEFLSAIANHLTDKWGGSHENRHRSDIEILDAVRAEWTGRLFVRISATNYVEGGNRPEGFLIHHQWMKEQGVDLLDCSSDSQWLGSRPNQTFKFRRTRCCFAN